MLADHPGGGALTFLKVNPAENVFKVENITGVIMVDGSLTQNMTYIINILVEDASRQYMKLVMVVVKAQESNIQIPPKHITVDVSGDQLPVDLVVAQSLASHYRGTATVTFTIVYGNHNNIASINETSGKLTLNSIPCRGFYELFVGLHAQDNSLQTVLQRITLDLVDVVGADLSDCSTTLSPPCNQQLVHVTVGPRAVFGINSDHEFVQEVGDHLEKVGTKHDWRMLDIGTDTLWAVDINNDIFATRYPEKKWVHIAGPKLIQVCASVGHFEEQQNRKNSQSIWGVGENNTVYHRKNKAWHAVAGPEKILVVSTGEAGVWAVTTDHQVLYRAGTKEHPGSSGTEWIPVEGELRWISSNRDVWGVDKDYKTVFRVGCSTYDPTGTSWEISEEIPYQVTQVDAYGDDVRGTKYKPQQVLIHITVGLEAVFGVNDKHELVKEEGNGWKKFGTKHNWKMVDIDKKSLFGIDSDNQLFLMDPSISEDWKAIGFGHSFTQVAAGYRLLGKPPLTGILWAVSTNKTALYRVCYTGKDCFTTEGGRWISVNLFHDKDPSLRAPPMLAVASGEAGVWGVTTTNHVLYREGTQPGGALVSGLGWIKVDGSMKWISSNTDVWGVGLDNRAYFRVGVTADNPTGSEWKQMEGNITELDAYGDTVRAVCYDVNGQFRCPGGNVGNKLTKIGKSQIKELFDKSNFRTGLHRWCRSEKRRRGKLGLCRWVQWVLVPKWADCIN